MLFAGWSGKKIAISLFTGLVHAPNRNLIC